MRCRYSQLKETVALGFLILQNGVFIYLNKRASFWKIALWFWTWYDVKLACLYVLNHTGPAVVLFAMVFCLVYLSDSLFGIYVVCHRHSVVVILYLLSCNHLYEFFLFLVFKEIGEVWFPPCESVIISVELWRKTFFFGGMGFLGDWINHRFLLNAQKKIMCNHRTHHSR